MQPPQCRLVANPPWCTDTDHPILGAARIPETESERPRHRLAAQAFQFRPHNVLLFPNSQCWQELCMFLDIACRVPELGEDKRQRLRRLPVWTPYRLGNCGTTTPNTGRPWSVSAHPRHCSRYLTVHRIFSHLPREHLICQRIQASARWILPRQSDS